MATDIGEAYVQIVPSAKGISGSITSVITPEASSAGLSGGALLGGQLLGGLSGVLTGAAVVGAIKGLTDGIGSCVSEYANFDEAMSQVSATMGVSKSDITELTDLAKNMGATTSFSAQEAAEGLNILAMAGLDADEQMAALPVTLDLAAAGSMELEDAASYVTGAVMGFGDSMDNAQYYADLMANGATLAKTDVNELGEAMSGSAATASAYGQSAESVTLSLLKLANQNITGSQATTMLNRTMADLYTPTSAAKSALDELGISCYDAEGNARDFNDITEELGDALAGYDQETQNAYKDTIFTTNGLKGYNMMAATSKEESEELAAAIADSYGSASEQAATQLDNLNGDLTLFDSAVSGFKIAIGEKFDGICRSFVQFGTDALGEFTQIIDGTKSLGDVFSEVWNGIVDWFNSVDWIGIGTTVKDGIINGVKTLVEEVPGALADFATTVTSYIESVDWYAVGSKVADFIINGIKNLISKAGETVSNFCNTITSFISSVDWHQVGSDIMTFILNGIKALFTDVPAAISEFCTSIKDKITETDWLQVGSDIIQGIIDGIKSLFSSGVSAIQEFGSGLLDSFKSFFGISSPSTVMMEQGEYITEGLTEGMQGMPDAVNGELNETLGNINSFGSEATSAMTNAGTNAVSAINRGYNQVPNTVQNPLSGTLSNINKWGSDATTAAMKSATTFTKNTQSGMSSMPGNVNTTLNSVMSNVNSWSSQMSQQSSNVAQTFVKNFNSGWSNFNSQVSSTLSKVASTVTSWGSTLMKTGTSLAKSFVSNFMSGMSNMNSQVSSKLSSVRSTASGYSSKMNSTGNSIGRNLVQGMINGINSKSGSLYSTISSVVSRAVAKANSAAGTHSPSTKMEWTGEMLDRGLALGLNEYSGLVDDAMEDLMDTTQADVSDIMTGDVAIDTSAANGYTDSIMEVYELLEEYLPMLANLKVVMDSGETVGALAPKMNTALGKMSAKEARQ